MSTSTQNQDRYTNVVIFYVWTEIHVVSQNYDDDYMYSKANWTLIRWCVKTMRNKREMNQPEHDALRK